MWLYAGLMLLILFISIIRLQPPTQKTVFRNPHLATRTISGPTIDKRRFSVFIILCLFWSLCALKSVSIGSDTENYVSIFARAVQWNEFHQNGTFWQDLFVNDSRYETGYIVLNRIVAFFTDNVQWLFVVIATFCMVLLYFFVVKYSQNTLLSIFLFLSLRFLYFIMSGLRQAIAIFICVLAYRYIRKRKLIPFVLLVLLAAQMHMTAYLFLLAYPISYLKFNRWGITTVCSLGASALLFFNLLLGRILPMLPEYYQHYTTSERFAENKLGNILVALIQLLFLLLAIFSDYKSRQQKDESSGGSKLFRKEFDEPSFLKFMILVSFIFSLISLRATTLDRLFYYFWIFSVIYIPNILTNFKNKNEQFLLTGGTIIFTALYNLVLLYFRPEWNNITPFRFFWQ